jgi:hypothetical protein
MSGMESDFDPVHETPAAFPLQQFAACVRRPSAGNTGVQLMRSRISNSPYLFIRPRGVLPSRTPGGSLRFVANPVSDKTLHIGCRCGCEHWRRDPTASPERPIGKRSASA